MPGFSDHSNNNLATLTEMQQTKERFFIFISKLEDKLKKFAEASIPELKDVNNSDTDEFKREYLRVKAAVLGQIESILKKAQEVKEEKITYFPYTSDNHKISFAYYDFRNECYDRYNQLDELANKYREQIENTFSEDYEAKYQNILDEFESVKDKFRCKQCSSPITIDKIYFTTTYITCPACQTKNTFEPSSQAKMLEHLGRSLAEQRTRHLLKEHDEIPEKSQQLYLKRHELKLSLIREKDKTIIAQKEKQMQELEQQQLELEQKAPELYQKYLRAMFDEWNKINPDMQQEHEKFYTRLLTDNKIK